MDGLDIGRDTASRAPPAAEAEFRRLLEKLPAGAYTCDASGLITYYNPRSVELWGRSQAERPRRPLLRFFQTVHRRRNPDRP
jgi:PAS domain-containing protein